MLLHPLFVLAQGPQPGTPTFSPVEYHSYYNINVQNLMINVDAPIRSKRGFGTYRIQGGNYISVVGSSTKFFELRQPFNGGVGTVGLLGTEAIPGASRATLCNGTTDYLWLNVYFVDGNGTIHNFPGSEVDTGGCYGGGTYVANDASGFTLILKSASSPTWTIYSKDGSHTGGTLQALSTSQADPNGNTVKFSNNVYTDTLGAQALTVSVTGGVTNYTYKDSNANTVTVAQTMTTTNTASPSAWSTACGNIGWGPNAQYSFLTSVRYASGTSQQSTLSLGYEQTPGQSNNFTGRLASIMLPSGGQITFAYSGGTSNSGINCDGTPGVLKVYTPDSPNPWVYTHTPAAPTGTISTTTVVDPLGNETDYTFHLQFPIQIVQKDSHGAQVADSYMCYDNILTNCVTTPGFPLPVTQQDVFHRLAGQSVYDVTTTFYDNSSGVTYGNVIQTNFYTNNRNTLLKQYLTPRGTWNGSSCIAVGNYIQDRVCREQTLDGGGSQIALTNFQYNQYGNQTQVSRWTNNTNTPYLTSSATYNSHGIAATTTDVNNTVTTVTGYTCNSMLPTGTSVTVGSQTLTTSGGWDSNCNGGVMTSHTDYNSQIWQAGYADPFWRKTSFTDESQNTTNYRYSPTTMDSTLLFGNSTVETGVGLDGLGRKIVTNHQQAPGSSTWDTYPQSYDSNGRLSKIYMPCATGAWTCPTPYTSISYDALNRPLVITDGGGGTLTRTYPQNDVLEVLGPAPAGENAKQKQYEYDGLGRLTSVCEILASGGTSCGQHAAASGYKTSYAYSVPAAGGSQMVVTQGSQTRTYVYDGLGRLTSETNPESGTTQYVYDTGMWADGCNSPSHTYNGDLVQKKDANGAITCYIYDALHRLTDSGLAPSCRRFRYDTVSNGIVAAPTGYSGSNTHGRLIEVTTDNCASYTPITDEWFSYDARGQMTDMWELTPHSGGYYHTTVSYYPNGVVSSLSGIPGYTAYTYGVDGEGRTSTAAQGTTSIISGVTFNSSSEPLVVSIGTLGDHDTYTYDPATGRMGTYAFSVNGKTDVGTLTWNPNGTLRTLAITDGFNTGGTQTCNFGTSTVAGYDDLGRIVDDDCGPVWTQTFSYDQYNNLTKAGSSTWNPGYNSKNQYSTIGATYDAAGNITYDVTWHHYQWDAYNKVVGIGNPAVCGTSGTCLTYDALGRMVERVVNSTHNEVLYSPVGKTASMSGLTTVNYSYLPLPGGGTLYSTGSTGSNRNYQHKDWLGSARLESVISSSTISLDRAYAPYGEVYANFGSAGHYNFTGDTQEVVADGATFDTHNRELNSGQGRWISPDPAGLSAADPGNPQSWNRYAYVLNNPLKYTDPTGLDCDWTDCGGDNPPCDWTGGCGGSQRGNPKNNIASLTMSAVSSTF